jgi:hypothetical protein
MKTFLPNRLVLPFYFVGTLLVFFLGVALIVAMYRFTRPPSVDEARFAERRRNLAELRTQARQQLDEYGWVNAAQGVVRLPIRRAMELMLREWQNPAEGRSNLAVRIQSGQPGQAPAAP